MGIPSSILFRDEEDARHLRQIGSVCEPPPSPESIVMANALINSAPLVIGVTDPSERRKMASFVFKVSRALIGNTLADQLMYPPDPSFGTLFIFRMQERYKRLLAKLGRKKHGEFEPHQVYVRCWRPRCWKRRESATGCPTTCIRRSLPSGNEGRGTKGTKTQ